MSLKPYIHKVHYFETDKMQVVHHSNYIRWFESARIDILEQLGIGYDVTESYGMVSPVVSVGCQYKESARFNDRLEILCIPTRYTGVRLSFRYEVKSLETGGLCATGTSEHCFSMADSTGRPLSVKRNFPEWHSRIVNTLREHYDDIALRD